MSFKIPIVLLRRNPKLVWEYLNDIYCERDEVDVSDNKADNEKELVTKHNDKRLSLNEVFLLGLHLANKNKDI